jgi:CRP/FNR family cyclic AMP-dependent transcriptional regulator
MTIGSSVDTLSNAPLFQGMTERALEAISRIARPVAFASGDQLVREGDPGTSFLIILRGDASVTRNGSELRRLVSGDFLGEISLIDGGPRTATVIATLPVEALEIPSAEFLALIESHPAVRLGVLTALTERIRSTAPEDV